MKKLILVSIFIFLCSCTHYNYSPLIDKSPQNWRKNPKLELTGIRGFTNITIDNGIASNQQRWYNFMRSSGYYSKKGIINMWGPPDKVEKKNGIEYYSFYQEKYPYHSSPPGPAVLGFKGDELVYIQTWEASHE
jgi:hypothetical protein